MAGALGSQGLHAHGRIRGLDGNVSFIDVNRLTSLADDI